MKKLVFAALCCAMLASCHSITTAFQATSNPVGNKCGTASYITYCWGMFANNNIDTGIDAAVKEAGITKISHIDKTVRMYGFLGSRCEYILKVYGE